MRWQQRIDAQLEREGVRLMSMKHWLLALALAVATLTGTHRAYADVVTDANAKAADIASRHPFTPPAVGIIAYVQVSVFEAVDAITGRYPPPRLRITAVRGA